jgi:hypothetical protein
MTKVFETDRIGVLGGFEIGPRYARLLFYPYGFDPDPGLKPVLAVTFLAPRFATAEVEALDPEEVFHIEIFDDHIRVWSGMGPEEPNCLYAESITYQWEEYGLEDFRRRVVQLETTYQELTGDLRQCNATREDVVRFLGESIRRAEIKAAISDDHHARQSEAIAALQRVLQKIKGP